VIGPAIGADATKFRSTLARRMGLLLTDDELPRLERLLVERLRATNTRNTDEYLARRLDIAPGGELEALAEVLGVAETHFGRQPEQLRELTEVALPACLEQNRGHDGAPRAPLRILSAGCASGEEPYSIAIAIREQFPALRADEVEIIGVDINRSLITKARHRRYTEWSFRQTPHSLRERYFRRDGNALVLADEIARNVVFEQRNLIDEDPDFYRPNSFDVVFCRNVLMYFTTQAARAVTARLGRALRRNGFLFLGAAETLRGISDAFELRQSEGAFYYQRVGAALPATDPIVDAWDNERVKLESAPPAPLLLAPGWVRAIASSADRINALTASTETQAAKASAPYAAPATGGAAPQVVLARAVLHAEMGEFAEAVRLCREVLKHEPGFAMSHLHLALWAKTHGQVEVARREFAQALAFLPEAPSSHIIQFGGGFTRETLIRLCRGELGSSGGQP
jgi:chemotaxis protein methyltransferase CheR